MSFDSNFQTYLSKHLSQISHRSAQAVIDLSGEGATVPFIARYRKEKTGNLNELEIRQVLETAETWSEILKRQSFMIKEIEKQGNLTQDLRTRIGGTFDLAELDEIYAPYKKKKKTKATIAREAGLEPLAEWVWDLGHGALTDSTTLEVKAKGFINPAAKFVTYEEVLKGAQDILVERITNTPDLRKTVREEFFERGGVQSQKTKFYKNHSKFEMYAEFKDSVQNLLSPKTSHRYLAMRRGWHEGELKVTITADEERLLKVFMDFAVSVPPGPIFDFLAACARTALTVHVIPSVTNEIHRVLKDSADTHAIAVFADNLRRVLMGSPFGPKVVLGVDPGLRTGCKLALIDKSGHFISHTVLQILGENAEKNASKLFGEVFKQIKIEAVAVGNGTAGRETETFLRKIFAEIKVDVPVIMVNESGASVYSASDVAREEFPELDVTVRGAVSIARRLQDPLAELVKIEPKSIGVGQYQHDVSANHLKKSLESTVESCVNQVGVDLNTASTSLLRYVSGIGESLARNIVDHRKQKGLFTDRDELLKVSSFSSKAFEQAAGFLRVFNGKSALDTTGIHPERYTAVREMAHDLGIPMSALLGAGAQKLRERREKWVPLIGEYTFDDIISELEKPGRDPRDPFKIFKFREDIHNLKDLKEGMTCPGLVTNVTNFGAFVDIGVHQDGLVHISHLSHKFVEDPKLVVNPGDAVQVRVLAVDLDKNQISLSMLMDTPAERRPAKSKEKTPRPRPAREAGKSAGPKIKPADGEKPKRKPSERPKKEAAEPPPPKQVPAGRPYKLDPRVVQAKLKEMKARQQKKEVTPGLEAAPPAKSIMPRSMPRSKDAPGAAPQPGQARKGPAANSPFNNPFAALLTNAGDSEKKK